MAALLKYNYNFILFLAQNIQLQQENAEIKQKLQNIQDQSDMVQQAIRDRDEAIAKLVTHRFSILKFK